MTRSAGCAPTLKSFSPFQVYYGNGNPKLFQLFMLFLQNTLPNLYSTLRLEEEALWREFMTKGDVIKVPPHCTDIVSDVQFLLIVQALRPDKLHSTLTSFALQTLGKNTNLNPFYIISEN